MTWPDRISVYHKLRTAPAQASDSFILDVLILSEKHQRPAARCVEDIVIYDYQRGTKAQLPAFMTKIWQDTFARQEEAKRQNRRKIQDLFGRVERLEKDSWDRADAVEDVGYSPPVKA